MFHFHRNNRNGGRHVFTDVCLRNPSDWNVSLTTVALQPPDISVSTGQLSMADLKQLVVWTVVIIMVGPTESGEERETGVVEKIIEE